MYNNISFFKKMTKYESATVHPSQDIAEFYDKPLPIDIPTHQETFIEKQREVPSEFTSQYRFFLNKNSSNDKNINNFKELLEDHHILYQPNAFQDFKATFSPNTHDCEVMTAIVNQGNSQFRITILNVNLNYQINCQQRVSHGSQGEIYLAKFKQEKFILKIRLFNSQNSKRDTILYCMKQYCFLKFCSAIKCGPTSKNYLGFDLIIYDNCVVFAMQKVQMLQKMTQRHQHQLKDALSSLHLLKMVHCDIKPQNIGFSPTLQKAIYIDFGLSEFLEEQNGLKSHIFFRGSVSFCGEEMMRLFLASQTGGWVDLYYNDVECLKKTVQQMKLARADIDDIYEQENRRIGARSDLQKKEAEAQVQILVYLFKFSLCFNQPSMVKHLVESSQMLNFTKCREILQFVKKLASYQSLRNIYLDHLSCFKKLPQYDETLAHLQDQTLSITISDKNEESKNDSELQNNQFRHRYIFLTSKHQKMEFAFSLQCLKQNYLIFLSKFKLGSTIQQQHTYFDIFLECIRFDNSHFQLDIIEKNQISINFCRFFSIDFSTIQQNSLLNIQKCLTYLLSYCLSSSFKGWKRETIFFIIEQSIYSDCDFSCFYSPISHLFHEQCSSFDDQVFYLTKISKIVCILKYKHLTESAQCCYDLLYFFVIQQKMLQNRCLSYRQINLKETYQKSIFSVIEFIHRKIDRVTPQDQAYFYQTMKSLSNICNYELLQLLERYTFFKEMHRFIDNPNRRFMIYDHFRPIMTKKWQQQPGFIMQYYLGIYMRIMKKMNNSRKILYLLQKIKSIINCSKVYSFFKFNIIRFFEQKSYRKIEAQYLILELKKCKNLVSHSVLNAQYFQLAFLLETSKETLNIQPQYRDIFKSITVCFYSDSNRFASIHQWESDQFEIMRKQALLFILQITSYSEGFLELQNRLEKFQSFQKTNKNCFVCSKKSKLVSVIYLSMWHFNLDQLQKSFEYFEEFLVLAGQFCLVKLMYYCLSNLLAISNGFSASGNSRYLQNQTYRYHYTYYRLNEANNTFYNYFSIRNFKMIYYALDSFRIDKRWAELYTFLIQLVQLLSSHATSAFVEEWWNNIAKFADQYPKFFDFRVLDSNFPDLCWQNRYMLCYYAFSLGGENDRTALFRLSTGFKSINSFTRNLIINRYYDGFMKTKLHIRKERSLKLRILTKNQDKDSLLNHEILKKLKRYNKGEIIKSNAGLQGSALYQKLYKYFFR